MSPRQRTRPAPSAAMASKRVRKVGKAAFEKIETSFENTFKHCQDLQKKIESLEQVVKERKVISLKKDGSAHEEVLTPVQVIGYKKQLNEARLELKFASKKLSLQGIRYAKASRTNSAAAKEKVKKFNLNTKLARTAAKKFGEILKAVSSQVEALKRSDGEKYKNLKELALSDGRLFNTNLYKLMRREIRDGEIIKMMAVSPAVRAKAFREVRINLGWEPKVGR